MEETREALCEWVRAAPSLHAPNFRSWRRSAFSSSSSLRSLLTPSLSGIGSWVHNPSGRTWSLDIETHSTFVQSREEEEEGGSQFYALAMETAYLLSLCHQHTIAHKQAGAHTHTTQTQKAVVHEVTNTI